MQRVGMNDFLGLFFLLGLGRGRILPTEVQAMDWNLVVQVPVDRSVFAGFVHLNLMVNRQAAKLRIAGIHTVTEIWLSVGAVPHRAAGLRPLRIKLPR